jgi:hypothetical protein
MTPLLLRAFAHPHATAPVCPPDDFLFRAVFHRSKSSPHSLTEPPISCRSPSSCALAVFPQAVPCMTGKLENAALSSSDVPPGFVQQAS